MKRYILAALCFIFLPGCDTGGFLGGGGQVVTYSVGCGDRGVSCPGGDINYNPKTDDDYPTIYCSWRCAVYHGEVDYDSYREEGYEGGYILKFRQKADGCWETESVIRGFPDCG